MGGSEGSPLASIVADGGGGGSGDEISLTGADEDLGDNDPADESSAAPRRSQRNPQPQMIREILIGDPRIKGSNKMVENRLVAAGRDNFFILNVPPSPSTKRIDEVVTDIFIEFGEGDVVITSDGRSSPQMFNHFIGKVFGKLFGWNHCDFHVKWANGSGIKTLCKTKLRMTSTTESVRIKVVYAQP